MSLLHQHQYYKKIRSVLLQHINTQTWILIAIIILAAVLRLYDFNDLARFNADQVRDATIVTGMYEDGNFPLLGPKAGGTKFKLGPAFYYLEYFSGSIFGFSPWGIALFIPLISLASVGLFYLLFQKIFSKNITLLLTFLYASSFYSIKYSRFAWNPNVIPFFILAFVLLLIPIINKKATAYTYILLGFVLGIGIQLHTTLLILLPVTLCIVLIFLLIKDRRLPFLQIMITCCIVFILNTPFIYSDYIMHGSNTKEFLAGTQKKTGSDTSLIHNFLTTGQFFAQGITYTLTGFEPQKNWIRFDKFIHSHDRSEHLLFIFSMLYLSIGTFIFIKKIKQTKNIYQKNILILLSTLLGISFLLFFLIGTELNTRFFIMIIFFPYLILGAIFEYITKKCKAHFTIILIFCIIPIIFIGNLFNIYRTYDLNNYKIRESAYGGISLREIEEICTMIKKNQSTLAPSQEKIYIDEVVFKRSILYVCEKDGTQFEDLKKDQAPHDILAFMLTKESKKIDQTKINNNHFTIIDSKKIGRFQLYTIKYE